VKTVRRIATAVSAAVVAIASIFVAAPAFAHEEVERFNPAAQFSTAGEPVQVYAILICGIILLAIVLVLAQWIGSAFDKKS